MNVIEKDWKALDWSRVDLRSDQWTWGRGGAPLLSDEWFVEFFPDDISAKPVRYKLPDCVSFMLSAAERDGREAFKREISAFLAPTPNKL